MSQHSDIIEPSLHKTATNITLSPELFEKLYLTPKVPHVGDAYKRYANTTPMGFVGFVISTFSFAMVMMGWGGAAGLSGVLGIFFFVGPVLLLLGTIFEWIMGNFFPVSCVCWRRLEIQDVLPLVFQASHGVLTLVPVVTNNLACRAALETNKCACRGMIHRC